MKNYKYGENVTFFIILIKKSTSRENVNFFKFLNKKVYKLKCLNLLKI